MNLPVKVDARWIATLADNQLVEAEAQLHAEFVEEDRAERRRMGAKYAMLRGPESLVSAWLRWLLVNNETYSRGVLIRRQGRARA
jgi:hypothetical protein